MKLKLSRIERMYARIRRQGVAPGPLIHPVREWGVSLLVSVLVAFGLFSYAGTDFYMQYTDSNRPEVSEESIPRYRESDALLLIRAYEGKADAFEALRKDRPLRVVETEISSAEVPVAVESAPE